MAVHEVIRPYHFDRTIVNADSYLYLLINSFLLMPTCLPLEKVLEEMKDCGTIVMKLELYSLKPYSICELEGVVLRIGQPILPTLLF